MIKPGWGFSFDYQPGQYIGIGLLVDGRWRWRSYSLTSCPAGAARSATRTVTITVKAMPEGFLSSHLVAGVEPGTIVRLAAPQGEFRACPTRRRRRSVRDRRIRDHAGDVDAANVGAPQPNCRHHPPALGAHRHLM